MRAHIRIARSTNNIEEILKFYKDGLGFSVLSFFEDHDGFDGIMLGHPQTDYHLEFTKKKDPVAPKAPTKDNLLVFYIPTKSIWQKIVDRMINLGFIRLSHLIHIGIKEAKPLRMSMHTEWFFTTAFGSEKK